MGCASSSGAVCIDGGVRGGKDPTECSVFQKYAVGPKLGKGHYAQVRAALCTLGHDVKVMERPLAVKVMDLRADPEGAVSGPVAELRRAKVDVERMQDAIQEAGVWRKAGKHPQIVGLVDAFLECGASFFVMEMCDCSLLKFLEKGANHRELNERALGFVFKQNLLACKHIHGLGIVHRDIKPDNFMVQGQAVKMCDFGLSAVLAKSSSFLLKQCGLTGVCGSAPYMAPEMLKGKKYGAEVDLWSVGVMTYVLFFGAFPYNGSLPQQTAKEMKMAIRNCNAMPTFAQPLRRGAAPAPRVSESAVSFCKGLLHRCPIKRWTVDDALVCGFLKACETRDESLPSMLPVLWHCKRAGVFEKRRLEEPEKLDELLERLHKEFRGAPMDAKMLPKEIHCDSAASEASTAAGSSLPSNLCKQSNSPLGSACTGNSSVASGA